MYTQIFLSSNWSFLKSQFIIERNISQIYPTAVFPMDVFSLSSAICSNYSLIVLGLKAWQVYNHYEKFLECISFHLGRKKGREIESSTLALVCPSMDEVGWKQTELEHSSILIIILYKNRFIRGSVSFTWRQNNFQSAILIQECCRKEPLVSSTFTPQKISFRVIVHFIEKIPIKSLILKWKYSPKELYTLWFSIIITRQEIW